MKIKGKYKGNKNVKLDIEPDLPIDADVFVVEASNIGGPENEKEKEEREESDEYFLFKIAKLSQPANRTDYSETYHDILSGIE